MSNLEIQREEIIEIVGTQYEGRAINHADLRLQQKLVMKRQKDNIHDANAILMLTQDGKELGFIPKGQASLYAPAMDSDKYRFDVEIIKTEYDPVRPILIVRIVLSVATILPSGLIRHLAAVTNFVIFPETL